MSIKFEYNDPPASPPPPDRAILSAEQGAVFVYDFKERFIYLEDGGTHDQNGDRGWYLHSPMSVRKLAAAFDELADKLEELSGGDY